MMTLSDVEKKQSIRADVVKAAFDKLEYLGHTFSMLILKYLTSNGVVFDNKHYCSLNKLKNLLAIFLAQ